MKRLKKLILLIFVVACLLVLCAFQDWWNSQYDVENPFGRGVRKLSAVATVNSTKEQKSTVAEVTTKTIALKTTKASQVLSKPHAVPITEKRTHAAPTIVKKSRAVHTTVRKISINKTRRHSNPIRSHSVGSLFKLNSSSARLLVANAMLKSKPMKIIKKDQVVRILLVTYFRGGSTFLGDILQQNWKTFYHFEPLHYMSITSRINETHQREAFNLLSLLYRCNFDPLTHYTKWAMIKDHQFLFRRNLFLWSMCHIHPQICFTPYYLREICLRAPVQVMKVTRLYLKDALRFLKENGDLKIKLIYLTRDPRGIFSSRRVLDWCQKDGCASPETLCKDMSVDVELLRNDTESFKWLRYEELCLNPGNVTKSLYQWLGIPYTIGVSNFLRSHTKANKTYAQDPYSTLRNTAAVAFEWLNRLSFPEVQHVQSQCTDVMRALKYKVIESNTTYNNFDGPESVLEVMP